MNTKIRLAACCAVLLAFGGGCGSSSSVVSVEPHPTIIEVNPLNFPSGLACGTGTGQLQRYVATLTDKGVPAVPLDFDLPSSAPARCAQGVAFGLVVPGHFYVAQIDGYDRSDLEQLAPGTPILVDPTTREPVAPRWSTACATECTQEACPPVPVRELPGLKPDDHTYDFAVRAESELTQRMAPCWSWQNL